MLERSDRIVWGAFSTPRQPFAVAVDLQGPAFKCNCPSRKFPCKHALGLLLLLVGEPSIFHRNNILPEAIRKWIEGRDKRSATAVEQPKEVIDQPLLKSERVEVDPKRLELMQAGLDELENRLLDLMQQGLAQLSQPGSTVLQTLAARLVDAKLGGIARQVRLATNRLREEEDYEQLLAEIGAWYLLIRAFRQMDQLPTGMQADVLQVAGLNLRKEELLQNEGIHDHWSVLGQVIGAEENLQFRRVWLAGARTGHFALLLDFAFGSQGFEVSYPLQTCFEGSLVFYPSATPFRALVRNMERRDLPFHLPKGYSDLEKFYVAFANAVAKNPWLQQFPAVLEQVVPVRTEGQNWLLSDKKAATIPLDSEPLTGWKLLAVSGGRPIRVFGEWDGSTFKVLYFESQG